MGWLDQSPIHCPDCRALLSHRTQGNTVQLVTGIGLPVQGCVHIIPHGEPVKATDCPRVKEFLAYAEQLSGRTA